MYIIPVHVLFYGYVCRFKLMVRRALVVFLCCETAVIGKFIRMCIEYSFPTVRNVIQKSSRLHSSKYEGTVYNSR